MSKREKLSEFGKVWCDRAEERWNFLEEEAEDGTTNLVLELRLVVDSDGDLWVETQEQARVYDDKTTAWNRINFKLKKAMKRARKLSKVINRDI